MTHGSVDLPTENTIESCITGVGIYKITLTPKTMHKNTLKFDNSKSFNISIKEEIKLMESMPTTSLLSYQSIVLSRNRAFS